MAALTENEIETIISIYRETQDMVETAKQTHHSITTVSKYLNKNDCVYKKKTCIFCGKKFNTKSKSAKYCSRRCRNGASEYKRSGCICNTKLLKKVCPVCGKRFETYKSFKTTCSDECKSNRERKRYKHTWDEYVSIRKEKAKQNAEIKRIKKEWYKAIHTVERECKICGSLFYCLDTETKKTCSSECSRKYKNLKHDKRIPKSQIIDADINIQKLFKRDKGKCWICGEDCNFKDIAISAKGNEYPGESYPVIEHVIPISRGGLHAWDNVRLAHSKCNNQKGDQLYPYVPLKYEFAYKERAKRNLAKKTAQYSLDGKLIQIWESTAAIERKYPDWKSKHIQNVCREAKTGNAYGYHWKYVVNNTVKREEVWT